MLPTYGLSMREWYCLSVFAPVRPVGSSNGSASRPTAPTPVPTGRIAEMGDPDSYAANAAARWSGVGASIAAPDGVLGVTTPTETRYLVCRRLASASVAELVASVPGSVTAGGRLVVEDPYGAKLEPTGVAVRVLRMPVMCRLSQPVTPVSPQGVTVTAVTGPDDLAAAEQVIVDGFPQPHAQPRVVGQTLPPHVLDIAGSQIWLARRDGAPAAAGLTFDDGSAVGVYSMATLPAHRSTGLGRAVLTAMLAAHPDRTATLVATDSGVPLYTSMGFTRVSTAAWYIRRL